MNSFFFFSSKLIVNRIIIIIIIYMRASYFRFARCKYVPTILSESLAQARVLELYELKRNEKFGSH